MNQPTLTCLVIKKRFMSECDLPLLPLILLQVRISDPCVTPPKMFDSNSKLRYPPPPFFLPPLWNLLLEHAYSVFSRDISNAGMMMVPSVIFVHIRCNSSLRVIRVIGCRGNWWTSWEFRALLILIICPLMIFGLNGMSQVCGHVYPSFVVIALFRRNV